MFAQFYRCAHPALRDRVHAGCDYDASRLLQRLLQFVQKLDGARPWLELPQQVLSPVGGLVLAVALFPVLLAVPAALRVRLWGDVGDGTPPCPRSDERRGG